MGAVCWRLVRWFLWTAVISVLPFLGVTLVQYFSFGEFKGLQSVVGSGQLLPTSIALWLGGVKEVSTMTSDKRSKSKDVTLWTSVVSSILAGIGYGMLLGVLIGTGGVPPDVQGFTTTASLIIFGASFVTAAFAVMISTPGKAQSD